MKDRFRKVLVLSASAGAGHVRAAQAIERAIEELGAAEEVLHVDALEYTTKPFRALYSKAYIEMVNSAPSMLGWLYDRMDEPWKNEKLRLALDRLNARKFVDLLESHQPEICICTHFLPSEIISWLKSEGRLASRQAIVVTDLDVHAMWLCRHHEHYFVALEETRQHLVKLGLSAETVTVSGIPIDPVFAIRKDRAEMRRKHGIDPGKTVILVSAGGFGVGPMESMVRSLAELRHPAQIVAVCGRSEEARAKLEALQKTEPRADLKVLGYTKEMDELMAASDILVGKPGGMTLSEALAKEIAIVIVSPIPGQEERNADHLLEEGAAIRANNLPVVGWKVDRLLDDPAKLESLRSNARRLARPDAAKDIVRRLLEIG